MEEDPGSHHHPLRNSQACGKENRKVETQLRFGSSWILIAAGTGSERRRGGEGEGKETSVSTVNIQFPQRIGSGEGGGTGALLTLQLPGKRLPPVGEWGCGLGTALGGEAWHRGGPPTSARHLTGLDVCLRVKPPLPLLRALVHMALWAAYKHPWPWSLLLLLQRGNARPVWILL